MCSGPLQSFSFVLAIEWKPAVCLLVISHFQGRALVARSTQEEVVGSEATSEHGKLALDHFVPTPLSFSSSHPYSVQLTETVLPRH